MTSLEPGISWSLKNEGKWREETQFMSGGLWNFLGGFSSSPVSLGHPGVVSWTEPRVGMFCTAVCVCVGGGDTCLWGQAPFLEPLVSSLQHTEPWRAHSELLPACLTDGGLYALVSFSGFVLWKILKKKKNATLISLWWNHMRKRVRLWSCFK